MARAEWIRIDEHRRIPGCVHGTAAKRDFFLGPFNRKFGDDLRNHLVAPGITKEDQIIARHVGLRDVTVVFYTWISPKPFREVFLELIEHEQGITGGIGTAACRADAQERFHECVVYRTLQRVDFVQPFERPRFCPLAIRLGENSRTWEVLTVKR